LALPRLRWIQNKSLRSAHFFLANWEVCLKKSHWPEMDKWVEAKEFRTWSSTLKILSYFDLMNMALWIKCPVFMGVGLQDPVCPPAANFAGYNRVKAPKQYWVYPDAKHYVEREHHKLVFNWIRENFDLEPAP
jgi:cephalosporin-C deacetylase-like acetyl esterase